MRTLKLTSPLMEGQDVKDVQKILRDKKYYTDKIDGKYGPNTARAVSMAKWDIGYQEKNVNDLCGPTFVKFITGKKKQTILMKQRAKGRAGKTAIGKRAISIAAKYEGVSENPPGSNQVMFARWYGIIGPWCAMFVTYCMVEAGSKAFARSQRWAYCPFVYDDALHHRNGLTVINKNVVQPGDVVLFDWNGDGVADHIGMTTSSVVNGKFSTIEGNTSGTNPSDGGMVARNTHDLSSVLAFIRVLN